MITVVRSMLTMIMLVFSYVFTRWAKPVTFGNSQQRRTQTSSVIGALALVAQQKLEHINIIYTDDNLKN